MLKIDFSRTPSIGMSVRDIPVGTTCIEKLQGLTKTFEGLFHRYSDRLQFLGNENSKTFEPSFWLASDAAVMDNYEPVDVTITIKRKA
jgi:hypothetical protein